MIEAPDGRSAADLVVTAGLIVSMDADRTVWRDAALGIRDGRITAIGPAAEVLAQSPGAEVLDGSGRVVIPGLVNAHVHLTGPALFPGAEPASDPVSQHFPRWVLPPHLASTPADEIAAARWSALQLLRTGTTSVIEAGVLADVRGVAAALAPMGLRGALGAWTSDRWPGSPGQDDTAAARRALEPAGERYGGLVLWPDTVGHDGASDELLRACAARAATGSTGWTLHMSAGPEDAAYTRSTFGDDPIVHLERLGVLDERTVIAHGLHLSDADVAALLRTGATVVHCPGAALRLTLGLPEHGRHPELPHVALGTDTANASNHLDLLRAAGSACDVYGAVRGDRGVLTAERALEWATLGGARALGLAGELGQLTVGALADLVVCDCGPVVPNAANALVHGSPRVTDVVIAGRRVLIDGRVPGEAGIEAAARAAHLRVAALGAIPTTTGWPVTPAPSLVTA